MLSLLFHSQKKEFLDEYVPKNFSFRYIGDYYEKKKEALFDNPIRSEISSVESIQIFNLEQIWESVLLEELHRTFDPGESDRDKNVLYYLAYKTLKICSTYPEYREAFHFDNLLDMKNPVVSEKTQKVLKNDDGTDKLRVNSNDAAAWFNQTEKTLLDVVNKIYHSQCNHITLKIHQCLDYLRNGRYDEDEGCWDVDEGLLKGQVVETYDDMMRLLPPPFFITEVSYLKKKNGKKNKAEEVTLQSMSSGERQMLYSLSYIYYHIKNIASIKENGKRVVGYHHINLIFDEAELYYHPEYQRRYITRLLDHLAMCNINRTNIRSINIIIITHSPFILSDIPDTNILFLKKGDEPAEDVPQKILGANIYDLLKSGFFLDYAIGDMIQMKLNEIMKVYYELEGDKQRAAFLEKRDEFKFTIDYLGEEYLYRNFLHLYEELEMTAGGMTRKEQLETRKNRLQKEIEELDAQIAEA